MNKVLLCLARTHYCLAPDHYIIPVPFYTNTCIFCALNHLCIHPSASVCPHPFVCIPLSAPIYMNLPVYTHLSSPMEERNKIGEALMSNFSKPDMNALPPWWATSLLFLLILSRPLPRHALQSSLCCWDCREHCQSKSTANVHRRPNGF